MLLILVILLLLLWAAGLITAYTFGGLLHVLVIVAVVLFIVYLARRA